MHVRLAMLFYFTLLVISGEGQTGIVEKLKQEIRNANSEQTLLEATLKLCDQGYSIHPDTLMKYSLLAKKLAIKQKNLPKQTEALYYESYALTNKGLIDSALSLANQCLTRIPSKFTDPVLQANLLNQKGRCFMRMNQYKEAIEMGLSVINISEKSQDTLLQIKGKTLIGWAYLEMGQSADALKWHLSALRTTNDKNMLDNYGILYANIAINYNGLSNSDSAFYFIQKAIDASRKYENLFALSNSLAIKAQLLVATGEGAKAREPLEEVVAIRKLIGDPFYITSDMGQLAFYYAHNNQQDKGIEISKDGIAIAEKYKLDTKLFFLYRALAENYRLAGDYDNYSQVLEKIIDLKDSVYQKNTAEELTEMQTKYNLQKKENLIIRQNIDIARQQYFFWAMVLVFFFMGATAFLLFKDYKKKQKLKLELLHKEEERVKSEEIMKAQENERKRIAADLHDNLGAYASAILASVDELDIDKSTDNSYLLRNMKSNAAGIMMDLRDTIWVLQKDAISMTDISDRFKNYVQKISPAYPSIRIEINEDIRTNKLLSPQVALNVLRIMQEAIHNAFKHSHCTFIKIEIAYNEGPDIKITDNGIGIGDSASKLNGSGLYNMQMRAMAQGWKVSFNSISPSGTRVKLQS